MTDALPVLVDCEPYRARLLEKACADRWRIANGRYSANEVQGSAGIRASLCKSCPVGEERAKGDKAVPVRAGRIKRTKTLVLPDQLPAPVLAEQEIVMFQKRKCSDCPNMFQPTGTRSSRCESCREKASGGGSKPEAKPVVGIKRIPAQKPALTVFLEMQASVEAMKERHKAELEEAFAELKAFEEENPTVLAQARAVLERLEGRLTAPAA